MQIVLNDAPRPLPDGEAVATAHIIAREQN